MQLKSILVFPLQSAVGFNPMSSNLEPVGVSSTVLVRACRKALVPCARASPQAAPVGPSTTESMCFYGRSLL